VPPDVSDFEGSSVSKFELNASRHVYSYARGEDGAGWAFRYVIEVKLFQWIDPKVNSALQSPVELDIRFWFRKRSILHVLLLPPRQSTEIASSWKLSRGGINREFEPFANSQMKRGEGKNALSTWTRQGTNRRSTLCRWRFLLAGR